MLRTSIKCPLGHLARVASPRRPIPRKEIRLNQSTYSSGGGRGGGRVWLVVGTLTVATAGTAVYAKYDPSFRKLLEDNVPYSDSVLGVTTNLIDQVTNLTSIAQDKTSSLLQSAKEKVASEPEPVPKAKIPVATAKIESKQVTPAPAAVTPVPIPPASDESLMKKKQERDIQSAAERSLIELRSTLDSASLTAAAAYSVAVQHIKGLGEEFAHYSKADSNERTLAELIAKNLQAEACVKKATEAAAEAKQRLISLKAKLQESSLPSSSEVVHGSQKSVQTSENRISEAEKSLRQAQAALKPSQALQSQVNEAYHKLEQELGPGWDANKKNDQDLFVLLVSMRMMNYKEQLAQHSQADERMLLESLTAAGGEGVEERVQAHLEAKEEELRQLLSQEYQAQVVQVREEVQRQAQVQLHQQAVALAEDKSVALNSQKTAFIRELSERMGHQQQHHTQQIVTVVETLHKANASLTHRQNEIYHGAELLAMARSCDTLVRSLDTNPFPALDWTHQRRALDAYMRDLKQAFRGKHEFVNLILATLPDNVVSRGVFTEPACKARFHKVEEVARRVSMIPQADHISLSTYLVAYLRSTLLLQPVVTIKPHEIADDPVEINQLDNNAILDRARYFVDQGDLMQAVRYINLLRGPAQYVASGWLEETRKMLEVKHVAQSLAAYASLLVQQEVISPPAVAASKQ